MTTNHPLSRRDALLYLAALSVISAAHAAPTALPGNSVYQVRPGLTDQDGRPFDLVSLRGRPVLASMFYSSCDKVCPMIFETIGMTLQALPAADRDRVRVLMVSFDPARDSVAVLKQTAKAHQCDERWTLARTDEAGARELAAVLGVKYRRLADGEFNHSSTIELLDTEGRIAARTGKLAAVDPALLKALRAAVRGRG
ncbi:MAG: SCO family protein [Burkholderiaceae bacterium]